MYRRKAPLGGCGPHVFGRELLIAAAAANDDVRRDTAVGYRTPAWIPPPTTVDAAAALAAAAAAAAAAANPPADGFRAPDIRLSAPPLPFTPELRPNPIPGGDLVGLWLRRIMKSTSSEHGPIAAALPLVVDERKPETVSCWCRGASG
jgi:hypothetical protein